MQSRTIARAAHLFMRLAVVLFLASGGTAGAQDEATFELDLSAQPLDQAVTELAREVGITIGGNADLLRGKRAPALRGEYTVGGALQRLLADSGLDYRFDDSDRVRLVRRASDRLGAIRVEGVVESAYGPVDGYSAGRSATATRTDAAIRDTPAAIQVVPEDIIDDQQATEVREATRNVSSVQEAGTAGNRSQSLTVRGFDAGRFAKDGFLAPASFGDTGFNDLANVARVEVLKGPASILYGQTAPGGLVNIVTKKPQPEAFRDLEGTIGSEDFRRGDIDVNRPLGEQAGLRINASYQQRESFRDHFIDDKRSLVAPVLRWTPTGATTIDFQLEHFDQERQFDRGLVAIGERADALPQDRFLGESFSRFETDGTRFQVDLDHQLNTTWSVRSQIRVSDSDAERFSVDPRGLDSDGRTLNRRVSDLRQNLENYAFQTNLQGDFEGETVSHKVLVGVDLNQTNFASELDRAALADIDVFDPQYGAKPGAFSALDPQDRDVDFAGVYVQDLISFGERWKVLAGGRYEHADTRFQRGESVINDTTDKEFSPRTGVMFKPRPDTSLYASYTESFDPFVFQVRDSGKPFEPETGEQVEIGVKRSWLDERLSTTLAVFEITKENVLTPDPDDPDITIQTGEQRSRGIELDVAGDLTDNWRVIGSLAHLDAEVTNDNQIDEGNQLPNAPDWSANAWTVYDMQRPVLRGLSIGGGVTYVDERAGDICNTFAADSYTRTDLFARYAFTDDVRVKLNINNVFDEEFISAASGRTQIEPGAPAQAFLRLNVDF